MIYLVLILALVVVLLSGIQPAKIGLTSYELRRRSESQKYRDSLEYKRASYRHIAVAVINLAISLLVVSLSIVISVIYGPLMGVLLSIGFLFLYKFLAKLKPIRLVSNWLYGLIELRYLNCLATCQRLLVFMGIAENIDDRSSEGRFFTKEELLEIIKKSPSALKENDRALIMASLEFNKQTAQKLMTPLEDLTTIDQRELLGPVVLSELHQSGQDYVPVTKGDKKEVVGVLRLEDFLVADSENASKQAYQVMDRELCLVDETSSLESILSRLMDEQKAIAIVTSKTADKAIGLISARDIIQLLFKK